MGMFGDAFGGFFGSLFGDAGGAAAPTIAPYVAPQVAVVVAPIDLLLDENHDIVITDDAQWVGGLEAARQDLDVALRMVRGEWFLNLDEGVAYDRILGEKIEADEVRDIFRDRILARPLVSALLRLEVSFNNATRGLSVDFTARSVFGDFDHKVEL